MSIRAFVRLGSAVSVKGLLQVGAGIDTASIHSFVNLCSSISIRGFARVGSAMSTLDFSALGSSLSVRHFARFGSGCSIFSRTRLGHNASVLGYLTIASTVSCRAWSRFGSAFSVYDAMHIGSAFSVRGFTRIGSSVSVYGKVRLQNKLSVNSSVQIASALSIRSFVRCGSAMSMLDFAACGSSMSLRSYSRLGNSISAFDFVSIGSSMSLRSFARLGSSLSLSAPGSGTASLLIGKSKLISDNSKAGDQSNPQFTIFADENSANKGISLYSGSGSPTHGGLLHGSWVSENTVSSSDRRIKYDVLPLFKTIMKQHSKVMKREDMLNDHVGSVDANESSSSSSSSTALTMSSKDQVMSSIIKQIRPVSFKYKKQTDSKYNRFGFIAQELESVLPSVVVTDSSTGMKAVNYNDMIAVLALGIQSIDSRLIGIKDSIDVISKKQDSYYVDLTDRMQVIESMITKVLKVNEVGPTASDPEKPVVMMIGTSSNSADSSSDTSSNSANNATSQHMTLAEFKKKEALDQKRSEDKKKSEKILALLEKVNFNSDTWKNLSQERKDKLKLKLKNYDIDLDKLIEHNGDITKARISDEEDENDNRSEQISEAELANVNVTQFDDSELNSIESAQDQLERAKQTTLRDRLRHADTIEIDAVDTSSETVYA
jgi:acyl-[acyl carrier protein]--UDP-N-acetylglucosamine O-acyltransferase